MATTKSVVSIYTPRQHGEWPLQSGVIMEMSIENIFTVLSVYKIKNDNMLLDIMLHHKNKCISYTSIYFLTHTHAHAHTHTHTHTHTHARTHARARMSAGKQALVQHARTDTGTSMEKEEGGGGGGGSMIGSGNKEFSSLVHGVRNSVVLSYVLNWDFVAAYRTELGSLYHVTGPR